MRQQIVRLSRHLAAMALLATIGCDPGEAPITIDLSERTPDLELQRSRDATQDEQAFRFGFDLRRSPQEDARQYLPFLRNLEAATGYRFRLRFTPQGSNVAEDLGKGVVQFAAIGAGTYIAARAKYGVIPLARGLNAEGRAAYRSVIVTRPDTTIDAVAELRGKRFAFGSVTSTQGHLIPRIILAEHQLSLADLASYGYTGSHLNTGNEVAAGRFDAGAMQDTLGRELSESGRLRIIHTSKYYPSSCIAANPDLPAEVMAKVKEALLDFRPKDRDAAGLYHWNLTEMPNGFTEAQDEDYAELREWAQKLGYHATLTRQERPR